MLENDTIKRRSICSVKVYNGIRRLKRIGDIDANGKIVTYDFDPDEPKVFDNRNSIFWKDGPDTEGFIGIWDWSAIPNLNSPGKDYIESRYDPSESPIQIIEISKAYSVDSLIECLKEGIPSIPMSERVMFVKKPVYGKYEGALCEKKDLDISNVCSKLSVDVTALNVYDFEEQDIFVEKDIEFYKYLNIDSPKRIVLTKSHSDIIKEIVLKRASWSVAKQNGLSKTDWKLFKNFMGNISDDSIYQEIASSCNCGKTEAKKYLEDFISIADTKINEGDIDSNVLAKIVENNSELRESCEKLVESNWETKNQALIKEKKDELERVSKEIFEQEKKKKEVELKIEEEKNKLEKIIEDVTQYERLGNSVKLKVQEKIEEARKDATEFISQMVMLSPANIAVKTNLTNSSGTYSAYISGNECFDGEIVTYSEAIESIIDELGEAGVEGHYITSFATYMFSAYTNHAHLLLAGPNGESIANAFSIGMFGKYAGILDCNKNYSDNAVQELINSEDEVIIIKNPLCAEWRDTVMSLLIGNRKFLILLSPLAEDLIVEPKGLFNYVLPVFTESIINAGVRNQFVGKRQSTDYEKYDRRKEKPLYGELLKRININNLITNRIQCVLTDLHYLDKEADATVDYLYVLFPYMYITGLAETFAEKIKNEKKIDGEKMDYMLRYFGEIE